MYYRGRYNGLAIVKIQFGEYCPIIPACVIE